MTKKLRISARGNFISADGLLISKMKLEKIFISHFAGIKNRFPSLLQFIAIDYIQDFVADRVVIEEENPEQVQLVLYSLFPLALKQVVKGWQQRSGNTRKAAGTGT